MGYTIRSGGNDGTMGRSNRNIHNIRTIRHNTMGHASRTIRRNTTDCTIQPIRNSTMGHASRNPMENISMNNSFRMAPSTTDCRNRMCTTDRCR